MKLLLECHPDVRCYDESCAYPILAGRIAALADRLYVGFKVPRLTEQLGAEIFRDHGLPDFRNIYLDEPIIFMLRDVRDVVASMISLKYDTLTWLDKWGLPALDFKLQRDPVFNTRYAAIIAPYRHSQFIRIAGAALYWRYKVDALFEYIDRQFPVLPVRYEELVLRPEIELLRVCGFLRVRWDAALLRHHELPHNEVWGPSRAIGGTDSRRRIDSTSVGRWKQVLTAEHLAVISDVAGETSRRLYGELQ